MGGHDHNMQAPRRIRQLASDAINRIAAGEVVERPSSAVKELVENALDAGARRIDVTIAAGGKTLIRVADDGHGIVADELPLALCRHATSKLDGDDLVAIRFLGFRGEALAALAAVARLTLVSRAAGAAEAAAIEAGPGRIGSVRPAARARGTVVEIRDLFHATPARLKFLRSDRAEGQAVADMLRRLAMTAPATAFSLTDASDPARPRRLLDLEAETGDLFPALSRRLRALLGPAFASAALRVEAGREGHRLHGFATLPTHSRGAALDQYLFVNGRVVRDRLLSGALRAAYGDLLPRDRHPAACLFLVVEPALVDVNVHPAKAEVRFRDPGLVRNLVVTGLRQALGAGGHHMPAAPASPGSLRAFRRPVAPAAIDAARAAQAPAGLGEEAQPFLALPAQEAGIRGDGAPHPPADLPPPPEEAGDRPLGTARLQLFDTYILAQTPAGIVLVDQHAAHERLVYERLKATRARGGRQPGQILLIPDIVELDPPACAALLAERDMFASLGLVFEPFGGSALCLRESPAILGPVDGRALLADLADALLAEQESPLESRIDAILSRMACHGSVRAGRRLAQAEMDALLREMEAEPASLTCNHGRPTALHLARSDIERLFGRR
jgi:DNA mismatch repair protein MutL